MHLQLTAGPGIVLGHLFLRDKVLQVSINTGDEGREREVAGELTLSSKKTDAKSQVFL